MDLHYLVDLALPTVFYVFHPASFSKPLLIQNSNDAQSIILVIHIGYEKLSKIWASPYTGLLLTQYLSHKRSLWFRGDFFYSVGILVYCYHPCFYGYVLINVIYLLLISLYIPCNGIETEVI